MTSRLARCASARAAAPTESTVAPGSEVEEVKSASALVFFAGLSASPIFSTEEVKFSTTERPLSANVRAPLASTSMPAYETLCTVDCSRRPERLGLDKLLTAKATKFLPSQP